MAKTYDAIVVGARVAGSPTAMLLARKGYAYSCDRASFPSDTISTHLIHPPGITALQRWGLLNKVVASGCPASTPTRSTSVRSHSRELPTRTGLSRTAHAVPCWTRCCWMRR